MVFYFKPSVGKKEDGADFTEKEVHHLQQASCEKAAVHLIGMKVFV